MDGVINELLKRDISTKAISVITEILTNTTLETIQESLKSSETGSKGVTELMQVFTYLEDYQKINKIVFDVTLARGLSYYTGCIFEVVSDDVTIGSIGGGGRYDDLTSSFGLKNMSGVGVSFGAARMYDVMVELDLFPVSIRQEVTIICLPMDSDAVNFAFNCTTKLRLNGISADVYPEASKFKKQMKYAHQRAIPYVCIIGTDELTSGLLTVKNMETGEQSKLSLDDIISKFKP